jgi:DNA-binding CsgD family transcriptional regulator
MGGQDGFAGSAGGSRPRLLCLAAGDEDAQELRAVLSGIRSGELITEEPSGPGAATAVGTARRAVLVGPAAAAAIILGRSGGPTATPMIHVLTDHTPSPLDQASGTSHRSGHGTRGRVPTGPLADRATAHDRTVLAGLTKRESEVAELVGQGLNVEEIAARLGREKTTVISHRRSLLRKIGCRDALGIARFAYRTGIAIP